MVSCYRPRRDWFVGQLLGWVDSAPASTGRAGACHQGSLVVRSPDDALATIGRDCDRPHTKERGRCQRTRS